jgi:hypothetical protein
MSDEVMTVEQVEAANIPEGDYAYLLEHLRYELGKLAVRLNFVESNSYLASFTALLRLANGDVIIKRGEGPGRELMRRDVLNVIGTYPNVLSDSEKELFEQMFFDLHRIFQNSVAWDENGVPFRLLMEKFCKKLISPRICALASGGASDETAKPEGEGK